MLLPCIDRRVQGPLLARRPRVNKPVLANQKPAVHFWSITHGAVEKFRPTRSDTTLLSLQSTFGRGMSSQPLPNAERLCSVSFASRLARSAQHVHFDSVLKTQSPALPIYRTGTDSRHSNKKHSTHGYGNAHPSGCSDDLRDTVDSCRSRA
jgi:hypothetical protein